MHLNRFAHLPIFCLLAACARPVAPEGGPKDTVPPGVVVEKSTPNNTTRFSEKEIRLTFDEWVILQDAAAQVLVSPPPAKRPEVTLKGKTVILRFDKSEVLRPNTTYTIHFGTSVKDLHESNPASDLRFVFSTGDQIDSLAVEGLVLDAFSSDPVEKISVLLYDSTEDSIVCKERPYYVARTDKNGTFAIPNVRAGAFKCVAVDDANQNLKWDPANERIAFLDQAFTASDSSRKTPIFRLFKPRPEPRLLTQNANRYGLVKLGFSSLPDSLPLQPDAPGLRLRTERNLDTLLLWYDRPDSSAWKLVAGKDTVAVKALSRSSFLANNRLGFGDEVQSAAASGRGRRSSTPAPPRGPLPPKLVSVRPGKPVVLPFNNPVEGVDTSRWLLRVDTLPWRAFSVSPDSSGPRALRLSLDWPAGKNCYLTLLPGAVTDLFGTGNADTLRRTFTVPTDKQLGGLNLSLQKLTPGQSYLLYLQDGSRTEDERFFTADGAEIRLVFKNLNPANYTLQLIEDRNGNRRWDAGDYFARRQPERVLTQKLEPLRANWDLEAQMDADPGSRRN